MSEQPQPEVYVGDPVPESRPLDPAPETVPTVREMEVDPDGWLETDS